MVEIINHVFREIPAADWEKHVLEISFVAGNVFYLSDAEVDIEEWLGLADLFGVIETGQVILHLF